MCPTRKAAVRLGTLEERHPDPKKSIPSPTSNVKDAEHE